MSFPESSLRPSARPATFMTKAAAPEGQPAFVRDTATVTRRLDRSAPMLIGIFGKQSAPRALIRLPAGRIEKVAPGDRIAGETVTAIDTGAVLLTKGGRTRRLALP